MCDPPPTNDTASLYKETATNSRPERGQAWVMEDEKERERAGGSGENVWRRGRREREKKGEGRGGGEERWRRVDKT